MEYWYLLGISMLVAMASMIAFSAGKEKREERIFWLYRHGFYRKQKLLIALIRLEAAAHGNEAPKEPRIQELETFQSLGLTGKTNQFYWWVDFMAQNLFFRVKNPEGRDARFDFTLKRDLNRDDVLLLLKAISFKHGEDISLPTATLSAIIAATGNKSLNPERIPVSNKDAEAISR